MTPNTLLNNRYDIRETLGHGGFATTYLAVDTETQQKCAIKCLSFRKIEEWKTWELFEREAKILKNLDHPQIPDYIDFFTIETDQDVELYLVQEYVEGKSLAQLVREGKHFSETEVIRLALKILRILDYLHTLSPPLVHRDIKPNNIVVTPEGRAYLIDFGAVKDTLLSDYSKSSGVPTVVGTYGYMPLEQIEGRALPASDIYALGMTLLYLLSHKEPTEMEKKGLELDFRPHVNISDEFANVLKKMIAPDWTKRYQTIAEVKQAFDKLLTRPSTVRVPAKVGIAGLIGLLLLVGAGVYRVLQLREPSLPSSTPVIVATSTPSPQPAVLSAATATPASQNFTQYSVTGRLLFNGQPMTTVSSMKPTLSFLNTTFRQQETPEIEYGDDGRFRANGLFAGHFYLSVEIDANLANPNRFPGDFMKWGVEFDVPTTSEVVVEMAQVLHLTQPHDNARPVPGGKADTGCANPIPLRSPVRFAWEPLAEGVVYNYLVGIVDCVEQVYHAGSVVNERTTRTEVTLDLPPNNPNEKYSFHIFAEKEGRQIGRLYIHDEGPSDWNYDFQVISDAGTPETTTRPVIRGRLLFDGRPITDVTTYQPTFWFRNEDTGKEQSARATYKQGDFEIYGLPEGNFGVSVNIDANMQNLWSYPGDFRVWQPFSIVPETNPELVLNLAQILHLTSPQDNGVVMDGWDAECMDKPSFRSPVTFRWDLLPLGANVQYDYRITIMDCLNNYNYAETTITPPSGALTGTEVTVNLPPSRDNECYGFHLSASREERRVGMLITHGAGGYGWNYRFRVK